MTEELTTPTAEELARLSNNELCDHIEELVQRLFNDAAKGKKIDGVLHIYMIYQAEYYSRGRPNKCSPPSRI